MSDVHNTLIGEFILADLNIDDHTMQNATPTRKMFSSIDVSDEQYTEDNRGTGMQEIKSLARAAKVGPGLKNVVPDEDAVS